jgi:hypothetical protein
VSIFTARESFHLEFISGHRQCQSCHRVLHETTALVKRWNAKHDPNASLTVCDEQCWQDFDHNFWLEKAFERTSDPQKEQEFLDARIPTKTLVGKGVYDYAGSSQSEITSQFRNAVDRW